MKSIFYIVVFCFLLGDLSAVKAEETRYLTVIHFNVGQGDSTLFIGTNGKTMLLDTGYAEKTLATVLPSLVKLGIKKLDHLVISHYDSDHFQGVCVLGSFLTLETKIWDRGQQLPTARTDRPDKQQRADHCGPARQSTPYKDYIKAIDGKGDRRTIIPGKVVDMDLGAGVDIRALFVNELSDHNTPLRQRGEENTASIALWVRYGKFDYFTAGDLTDNQGLIRGKLAQVIPEIDVYHASHHGSNTSSSQLFLDLAKPKLVVISVGSDPAFRNYGHPNYLVMNRLGEAPSVTDIFMTNKGFPKKDYSDRAASKVHIANDNIMLMATPTYYLAGSKIFAVK